MYRREEWERVERREEQTQEADVMDEMHSRGGLRWSRNMGHPADLYARKL